VDCEETITLIHPYLDGELDLVHALEVSTHMNGCAACAKAAERIRAVENTVRAAGLRYSAPPILAERIRASLPPRPAVTNTSRRSLWPYLAVAASLLAVSLLGVDWIRSMRQPLLADRLVAEIVDDHVRSLMADHLLDVASSDKHTVRPWFAGKIDFAPSVPDLKDHNIPLVGGRLDVLAGQPVAVLVYQHGKHVVNVFIRPATAPRAELPGNGPETTTVNYQGFNVAFWTESGFDYVAVSDLNAAELLELVALLRSSLHGVP